MAKILQKYIKFSNKELEEYASVEESCVRRVNTDMHLSMGPYGLASFKQALHELLIRTKVGIYDANLNGIVLGIKNIKVQGETAALRADDPTMHLLINADFYVFRPVAGAILSGIVRHISKHQVSAIIYRVFNTTIRFTNNAQARQEGIAMEQDIKFRIKDFDISNVMPYIEGELLLEESEDLNTSTNVDNLELEVEDEKPNLELDALVELIKAEPEIVSDDAVKKKKSTKRKKAEESIEPTLKKAKKIKAEPL